VKIHRRTKTIALLASAALAQWAISDPARADSAVGVDTTLGNALNPAPVNPSTAGAWMHEESTGTRMPAARTPTGQFYDIPRVPVDEEDVNQLEDGWQSFGHVEFGVIGVRGDNKARGFREYKDLESGPTVQSFGRYAEQPDEARYIEVVGGGVGRYDQFYGLQLGRYNEWKVSVFYNETPHVFTTSYRSLWGGTGTDRLTLEKGLPPGGGANAAATQTSVRNAIARRTTARQASGSSALTWNTGTSKPRARSLA